MMMSTLEMAVFANAADCQLLELESSIYNMQVSV